MCFRFFVRWFNSNHLGAAGKSDWKWTETWKICRSGHHISAVTVSNLYVGLYYLILTDCIKSRHEHHCSGTSSLFRVCFVVKMSGKLTAAWTESGGADVESKLSKWIVKTQENIHLHGIVLTHRYQPARYFFHQDSCVIPWEINKNILNHPVLQC